MSIFVEKKLVLAEKDLTWGRSLSPSIDALTTHH